DRNHGVTQNILTADVNLVFNRQGILTAGPQDTPDSPYPLDNRGFYDDFFNVEGNWAARGAPAIVNFGSAHAEDMDVSPMYWYKMRNVVSGVVSNFNSDIPYPCDEGAHVRSSSGAMFGADFVHFF